jgi:Bacterial PH domain
VSGDFDFEPIPGLPAAPPRGEAVLWQGAPEWKGLLTSVFHARKVAIYFAALLVWSVSASLYDGRGILGSLQAAALLFAFACAAFAILAAIAWLTARTTVYTITSKRVVMRFGIALPITINIPFRAVTSASVRLDGAGAGDLPLGLVKDAHFAYLVLWPHARPWQVSRPQPMLRCVPDAQRVADILADAMTAGAPAEIGAARAGPDAAVRSAVLGNLPSAAMA